MSSSAAPDPYTVLGVPKDATAAAIRSAYKKLVLQTHPDKIQDESLRASKQDEFQRVQQAYEILSDEARRRDHDERTAVPQDPKDYFRDGNTRYEVRPAAPSREFERSYEERKAARAYEDEHYIPIGGYFRIYQESVAPRASDERRRPSRGGSDPRKSTRSGEDDYDRDRVDRDRQRQSTRENQSERRRTRDRERRRGYDDKYSPHVEIYEMDDDDDGDARSQVRVEVEDKPRKKSADARRADETTPRRDPFRRRLSEDDTHRKMSAAVGYMEELSIRSAPRFQRAATAAEPHHFSPDHRSPSPPPPEPDTARRSSARRSSDRDRGSRRTKPSRKDSGRDYVEIVEPAVFDSPRPPRAVPSMPTSASSPSSIKIPVMPRTSSHQRSATMDMPREIRAEPPQLPRSSTMPVPEKSAASLSGRRRDVYPGTSNLKTSFERDSGYSSPGTPETPQPRSGRSPSRHPFEDVHIEPVEPRYASHSGRHRKVSVEPDRYHDRRERSVSPHGRDRRSFEEPSSAATPSRPSLVRGSTTSARISPVRETSYVYTRKDGGGGSGVPSYMRRESSSTTPSRSSARVEPGGGGGYSSSKKPHLFGEVISPKDVQYARPIRVEDIRYSESPSHRVSEAVHRDAPLRSSRYDSIRGPHPAFMRTETTM